MFRFKKYSQNKKSQRPVNHSAFRPEEKKEILPEAGRKTKVLLVNPETPATFQNFRNALSFISKKSDGPPLGLLTVAALLPKEWEKKLVDANVTALKDKHLHWADYVFLTGMDIHGAQVYSNSTTRGPKVGILVPAADQAWPDSASGVMVFADNRSGEFDLYGIRLTNIRSRGREFPVLTDYTP